MKDIYIILDFDCRHTGFSDRERMDGEISRITHKAKAEDSKVSIFSVRNYPETTLDDLVLFCQRVNRDLRNKLTLKTKKSIKIYITGHGSSRDSTVISHSNGNGYSDKLVSQLVSIVTRGLHFWHRHEVIQIKLNVCWAGKRGDEMHSAAGLGRAVAKRKKSFAENLAEQLQRRVEYDFIITANKGLTMLKDGYRPNGMPVGMTGKDMIALLDLIDMAHGAENLILERFAKKDETAKGFLLLNTSNIFDFTFMLGYYIRASISDLGLPSLRHNKYADLWEQKKRIRSHIHERYQEVIQRKFGLVTDEIYNYFIIERLISINLESMAYGRIAEKVKIHRYNRELVIETKKCKAFEFFLTQLGGELSDVKETISPPDGAWTQAERIKRL